MVSRRTEAAYHGFTFRTHSNRPYRPAARPGRQRPHGPTVARHSQENAPMGHGCVSVGVRRVSWVLLGRRGHFAMVFTGVKCPCLAGRDGGLGRMPGMPGYPGGIGRRHGSFRIMRRSRPNSLQRKPTHGPSLRSGAAGQPHRWDIVGPAGRYGLFVRQVPGRDDTRPPFHDQIKPSGIVQKQQCRPPLSFAGPGAPQ